MPDSESLPTLADLLGAAGVQIAHDRPISGLTSDSREVRQGDLFVAIPGTNVDGHRFVEEAAERGAAAVVAEHEVADSAVPVYTVENARRALADMAAAWHGRPAEQITLVGITGSLGKTSVLTTLEAILKDAGRAVGAVGSEIIGMRLEGRLGMQTRNTTPDPLTLHRGFKEMVARGADMAAMEISSHALDQDRVRGLQFSAGIFTNLVALEHQDYHGSFEEYVQVKLRFLDHLLPGAGLIFGSDNERLRQEVATADVTLIGCGFGPEAAVRITDVKMTTAGTTFRLTSSAPIDRRDGSHLEPLSLPLEIRLLGRPHVLNSAFAAVTALHLGVDPQTIARSLGAIEPPHRRMELVEVGDRHILDDTAGHPQSIDAVFDVVEQLPHRKLHVVAAIRGKRGVHVNARLAETLAQRTRGLPVASLLVTESSDHVGEADHVSDEERDAYHVGLQRHGAEAEHFAELEAAIRHVIDRSEAGDLIVLIGAQGMRDGAGIARKYLSEMP